VSAADGASIAEQQAADALAQQHIASAQQAAEAAEAARALGYPVALKATAPHLRHRADLGGVRLDLAEVDAHLRERVAGYKVPRAVWLVGEISRTISGKADYRWAQQHAASHAGVEVSHAD